MTTSTTIFLLFACFCGSLGFVNQNEFNEAVRQNGFPTPSAAQYQGYVNGLGIGGISSKMEAAMFLAQTLHESGGLLHKEELKCTVQGDPCSHFQTDDWNPDCPVSGRRYYGRGYLQLSWCSNYRAASQGLGMGDTLRFNPQIVAQREDLAWNTGFFYWKTVVKSKLQNDPTAFGVTTRAINSPTECTGGHVDQSRRRFAFYQTVFRVFGIPGSPVERGCYI